MRTEFITSRVRPIKKLFVIEPNDYQAFEILFKAIQEEIDVIQNLIFINDEDLWAEVTKEFVKRSDPDVILNLSELDDDKLSLHFGIISIRPIGNSLNIQKFCTHLVSFTNRPPYFDLFGMNKEEDLVVLSAKKLENTPEALLSCINYGLYPKIELGLSIFRNLKPNFISKPSEAIALIFNNDGKYSHLGALIGGVGGSGHGSSIYEIDYNEENIFSGQDSKYFFISEKNDFKTISYFWNTRSYYNYSKLAWVPVNFLNDVEVLVDEKTTFVCFNQDVKNLISDKYPSANIISPSRLYFMGRNERWTFLKYSQTVNIENNSITVHHPAEKTFGTMGISVLEISGFDECRFPKRRSIGNLFSDNKSNIIFEERFQRVSEIGIAKYILTTTLIHPEPIHLDIFLPSFKNMINHIFEDIGYTIKSTQKGAILQQAVNLVGGLNSLDSIAENKMFNLLVSLTPKERTDKIVKKALEDAKDVADKLTSDNILEIIAEIKNKGGVSFPSVTCSVEEMFSRVSIKQLERLAFLPIIQKLYNQKVLLRGKKFQCPHCSSNIWIQIDEIKRINYCFECNNEVDIPIYQIDKQDTDYFKLNQLFVRAVDQGQLSTMLVLNLFFKQNYYGFEYQSNLEVFENDKLITDIDLLIKLNKRIGIIECKSESGFAEKQVMELVQIATKMQFDFIGFSTLLSSSSQEVLDIIEILEGLSLKIPAFIFTKEALFKPEYDIIHKYFEVRASNIFPMGPIIIE